MQIKHTETKYSKMTSFPCSSHTTPLLTLFITLIIFLFSSSQSSAIVGKRSSPTKKPFSKIFAFGDSYTDTGNTVSSTGPSGFNYVSNLPYGMTYFHHPTNRYSDGRLVIDFVTQTLSLPLLPAYRSGGGSPTGVNFAVAGSTAIEHTFFVKNNLTFDVTPESIGTQLVWFNKYLEKQGGCNGNDPVKCGALFDDALVWVGEIGANDYAYAVETDVSKTTLQILAITRISNFLEHLFFECHFSSDCFTSTFAQLGTQVKCRNLSQHLTWIGSRYKGNSFRKKVMYAVTAALVYGIWQARNGALWRQQVPRISKVVDCILSDSKCRIRQLLGKKVNTADASWISS